MATQRLTLLVVAAMATALMASSSGSGAPADRGDQSAHPTITAKDYELGVVSKLRDANQEAIADAHLGLEKSGSVRVRSYARHMIEDCTTADQQLLAFARTHHLELGRAENASTAADVAGGSAEDLRARIGALSGAPFDRAFLDVMLAANLAAIQEVEEARDAVADRDLHAILVGLLPRLQRQRDEARDIAAEAAGPGEHSTSREGDGP